MTAKEKAKDIYDKMKGFRVKNSHRKKCALIAVDEMINNQMSMRCFYDVIEVVNNVNHLQEVKEEIEKL